MILVIAGPTAAGKTAAALAVAEAFGARLVSADAMQVFRGMDIGTAKPEPAVLARHPHAGIDVCHPHDDFNAVDFAALADAEIAAHPRVAVVGGTAFYLRALLTGFVEAPSGDAALRAELEALPDPHAALAEVDPELAARVHPNDLVRVVRGLEVHRLTGVPLSRLQAAHAPRPRHDAVCLWLDRDTADLDDRINRRVQAMMAAGYLDEVRSLLANGVRRDARPMRSLGYRYLADHLLDGMELAECVRLTARDSRKLARKQRTHLAGLGLAEPERAGSGRFRRLHADDLAGVLAAAREAFGLP